MAIKKLLKTDDCYFDFPDKHGDCYYRFEIKDGIVYFNGKQKEVKLFDDGYTNLIDVCEMLIECYKQSKEREEDKMNTDKLIADGYKIENARIEDVDLSMKDHGYLTFNMVLDGGGWGCNYGGYCLGHGHLGAKNFDGSPKGLEYIMRIMDTVGVSQMSDLKGKYIRVATKGCGEAVKIIGNIISDKWFNAEEFFKNKNKQ